MKSLKKVRGKKVSQLHWRTMKPTFGWYEGESDSPSVQEKKLQNFYHLDTMGHKLTYHRPPNIKGSSFNF